MIIHVFDGDALTPEVMPMLSQLNQRADRCFLPDLMPSVGTLGVDVSSCHVADGTGKPITFLDDARHAARDE